MAWWLLLNLVIFSNIFFILYLVLFYLFNSSLYFARHSFFLKGASLLQTTSPAIRSFHGRCITLNLAPFLMRPWKFIPVSKKFLIVWPLLCGCKFYHDYKKSNLVFGLRYFFLRFPVSLHTVKNQIRENLCTTSYFQIHSR